MKEIAKVYGGEAIEDVTSEDAAVARDIRIASCNTLMLIASKDFIAHILVGDEAGDRAVRDIELAKAHGHRIVVILEQGQTFPPGILPETAKVVESELSAVALARAIDQIKEALCG